MALGSKDVGEQMVVRMLLIFYLQNYPAWLPEGTDTRVHRGLMLPFMTL